MLDPPSAERGDALAGATIGSRFAVVAREHASRPAILWPGGAWTYGELDERSLSWGIRFVEDASSAARPIAIALPRGPELIAALLGAARAGRPWTVLPSQSADRPVRETLEAIGPCDLVSPFTQAQIEKLTRGLSIESVGLQRGSGKATPELCASAAGAAAICFTSGSTGARKGVVTRHDSSVRNAERAAVSLRLDPEDRYLWLSSPDSAASCTALFSTLLSGACVLPFNVAERGLSDLGAWIWESQATVFHAIPSLFRRFARSVNDRSPLDSLRVVKLGGEPLFPSDVALFQERLPDHTRLLNGLGMSEANGNVCHETVCDRSMPREKSFDNIVPVGRSLPGFDLSLRDSAGNEVPTGEPGRLRIVSATLAEGYWDRSLGRAIPFPPLHPGSMERVFESEDRCRRLSDGRFVHLGRLDGIVKVRGKRVSLLGVETKLRELADVGEVVVDAASGAEADSGLTAWIEPVAGSAPTTASLRASLAQVLPPEAVPARLIVVDRLPLLPGGKVDRRRLSHDAIAAGKGDTHAENPSNGITRMAALFSEVLDRSDFGNDENVFEAGADSLAVATLAAAIESEWKCRLDPAVLGDNPTPARLFAALDGDTVRPAYRLSIGGKGLPLWLMSGGGGNVFSLLPLARALGGRGPVFGFLSCIDRDGAVASRIEAMSAPIVETIRRIQPNGPYLLAGSSFGGWVAFDVAQRLLAMGEAVRFLGMLDAAGPGYPKLASTATAAQRFLAFEHSLIRRYGFGLKYRSLKFWIVGLLRRTANLVRVLRRIDPNSLDPLRQSILLEEACLMARRRYRPGLFPGRITTFQAEFPPNTAFQNDPALGWSPYSSLPITSVQIKGIHSQHIQEPNVGYLSQTIIAEINRDGEW